MFNDKAIILCSDYLENTKCDKLSFQNIRSWKATVWIGHENSPHRKIGGKAALKRNSQDFFPRIFVVDRKKFVCLTTFRCRSE
jgi:hypothetical protein